MIQIFYWQLAHLWCCGLICGQTDFPEICLVFVELQFSIEPVQSDSFFYSFFPNVIQPPISVVANSIHSCFVRIGLCKKVVRKFDMSNPTGVTVSVPNADHHDMERRRQIALKALSERLSKSHSDRQPLLLPKSNPKVLMPPNFMHGSSTSATPPSTRSEQTVVDVGTEPPPSTAPVSSSK